MNLNEWAGMVRGRGLTLAKALGVQPPSVSDWITGKKPVPLAQCMPIERATGGAVTRRDLMPDTYLIHWPELAEPQQTPAQAAPESVATAALTGAPDGIDRRHHQTPQNPDLERREPLAAALALAGGA